MTISLFFLQTGFLCAQEGYVKGTVTNNKEKLAVATVKLGHKTTLTDNNGEFFITMAPGDYMLTITHAGYKKIERKVPVRSGVTQVLHYSLMPAEQMGEVVMVGSRSAKERSYLNTPVPVDVFTADELVQTAQLGLSQILNYLVPSFNAGRQELYEPVTLRGLDPHHVLILVNGVRYHKPAWLNNGTPKSNMGRGSVSNDLNSIPFSAVEKVEILRDGAAAQYGSDAIAGVINIILKKSTGETSVQLHCGQFYPGDGLKLFAGFNRGISLGKKLPAGRHGFLNFSADFRHQGATTRAGDFQGTIYKNYPPNANEADSLRVKEEDDSIANARGITNRQLSRHNGINKVERAGLLVNGGYPVGTRSFLFWTGALNYRDNLGKGTYRYPKNLNQVNPMLYPDGFRPEIRGGNRDVSVITGIRGELASRWAWKFSSSFGTNVDDGSVANSNNASQYALGKNAPTTFYLGRLVYRQYVNNIHFSKDFSKENSRFNLVNLAMGAELRLENYQQKEGDSASWYKYDRSPGIQGGAQPSIGSIAPHNTVNDSRTVSAAYIDLEIETRKNILLDLAGRYEYYDDFGGNLAGKLAFRYKFSEIFSVRGAASTGFRAPGMQQLSFQGTQSIRGTDRTGGVFSHSSPVTKAFGIPFLKAERSVNLSGGITSRISNHLNITLDAYLIQIRNRIVLSGAFSKTAPDVATILLNHPGIDLVQFYVNAINTRTLGIDAILHGKWVFNKTQLGFTLAANVNRNVIFGKIRTTDQIRDTARFTNTLLGIEEKTALVKDQPRKKILFSFNAERGRFGICLRNSIFGNTSTTTIVMNPIDTLYENFSTKLLTDCSISYKPKMWLTITAGANNIFDVYPDPLKNYRNTGEGILIYSNGAMPFGSNGGYYFLALTFSF